MKLKKNLDHVFKDKMHFEVKNGKLSIGYIIPQLFDRKNDLHMTHDFIEIYESPNKDSILKINFGTYSYVEAMDSKQQLEETLIAKLRSSRAKNIFASILSYQRYML